MQDQEKLTAPMPIKQICDNCKGNGYIRIDTIHGKDQIKQCWVCDSKGEIKKYVQEDVDKFLEDFKMVINGGVIAALIGLRALPAILRARGRGGMGRDMGSGRLGFNRRQLLSKPGNQPIRNYIKRYGVEAARRRFGNQAVKNLGGKFARSAFTNTARRGVVSVLGKTGTKSLLQFSKRFISPVLQKIPLIGGIVDFLLNYFVFKEPLGHAAFKAIGAGLFGALGAAIGGPFAIFTGIGGAMLGDFLGGKLADVILGDGSVDVGGIDEYTEYNTVQHRKASEKGRSHINYY